MAYQPAVPLLPIEAMVETLRQEPQDAGRRRPHTREPAQPDWRHIEVLKHRTGCRLSGITINVVCGGSEERLDLLAEHTAYVERTNPTSRQMSGL